MLNLLVLLLLLGVIALGALAVQLSRRVDRVTDEGRRVVDELKRQVWDSDQARTRMELELRRLAAACEETAKGAAAAKDRQRLLEQQVAQAAGMADARSDALRRAIDDAGAHAGALGREALDLVRLAAEAQWLAAAAEPDAARVTGLADDLERRARELRATVARRAVNPA
jgi:hypothetical protein